MKKTPQLLTDSEAADILRLTPRQVAKLARNGKLPSILLPGNEIRFDPADLEKFIDARRQPERQEAGR
jgi:excisionase family DNA binding protein